MPSPDVASLRRLVDEIFAEQPPLHRGETETTRPIAPEESSLPAAEVRRLMAAPPVCWGVSVEVGRRLLEVVRPGWRTLETGAGLTTLVFALAGASHTAVTPNGHEAAAIKKYARSKGIAMRGVRFAIAASEDYLPRAQKTPLDLACIDGKHAFPWPVLDWFYAADRLRRDGVLVLDDCALPGVALLKGFLDGDRGWEAEARLDGDKTVFYRKRCDSLRDVAWHMQWLPDAK